jgi:hypothetical protein
VAIVADDQRELAQGVAHGFRDDLADAGCAGGWCAFRVRLDAPAAGFRLQGLTVAQRNTRASIVRRESIPYLVSEERPIRTLVDLIASDPTLIKSLTQLRGCNKLFADFIRVKGPDAFVRTAYAYLLGRPADISGLRGYRNHLRAGMATPYELLLLMTDSEEYRGRPRQHCAPTTAAFPFRVSSS